MNLQRIGSWCAISATFSNVSATGTFLMHLTRFRNAGPSTESDRIDTRTCSHGILLKIQIYPLPWQLRVGWTIRYAWLQTIRRLNRAKNFFHFGTTSSDRGVVCEQWTSPRQTDKQSVDKRQTTLFYANAILMRRMNDYLSFSLFSIYLCHTMCLNVFMFAWKMQRVFVYLCLTPGGIDDSQTAHEIKGSGRNGEETTIIIIIIIIE